MLRDYNLAVKDPDLQMVAMSPGAVAIVGVHADGIVLTDVPGIVLVFYYARERDNRRILALDADGAAWAIALQASGDYSAIEPWKHW